MLGARNGLPDSQAARALCISITAHEALPVLEEQVANVLLHCPNSFVVLHLNRSFRDRISQDEASRVRLDALVRMDGVILNPQSFDTRWAHMFHAHVSNLRHVHESGPDHGAVLLMSSADLVFRSGLEEHVLSYDAGIGQGLMTDAWPWTPRVHADSVGGEILSRSGHEQFRISMHEGTFFNAQVARRMVAALDEIIPDWEYDDAYPKEEVFFPTLVRSAGAEAITNSSAYVLGFGVHDRQALAGMFREAGLAPETSQSTLAQWVRENAPVEDLLAGRFIISRLPRKMDNPTRMMVIALTPGEEPLRARWLASHLDALDLATLESSSRTGVEAARMTDVVHCGLLAREHETVFGFQAGPVSHTMSLKSPVSAGDFALVGTLPDPSGSELCTLNVFGPAPSAAITFSPLGSAITVQVGSGLEEVTEDTGFVLVAQELSASRRCNRSMLAEYDIASGDEHLVEFWFEVHETTVGDVRKQYFNEPALRAYAGESTLQLLTVPDLVRTIMSHRPEGLRAFVYLRLPLKNASIVFRRLRILG